MLESYQRWRRAQRIRNLVVLLFLVSWGLMVFLPRTHGLEIAIACLVFGLIAAWVFFGVRELRMRWRFEEQLRGTVIPTS